jgi:hypothetical protein
LLHRYRNRFNGFVAPRDGSETVETVRRSFARQSRPSEEGVREEGASKFNERETLDEFKYRFDVTGKLVSPADGLRMSRLIYLAREAADTADAIATNCFPLTA